MAEQSIRNHLQKLEEQLTCQACHQFFTNPKILSCYHSFCHKCIEDSVQVITSYFIACPTCSHHTDIPNTTGVDGLPVSPHHNYLESVYQMKTDSISQATGCDNCTSSNAATGYCKDCGKFFCQECINMHKKWASFTDHHVTGLRLTEKRPSRSISTEAQQIQVSANDKARQGVLTALSKRENDIKQQGRAVKEEVRILANEVMAVLQDELTKEVDTIIEKKLQVITKQRDSFERKVEESMKIGQTLLPEKHKITPQINIGDFLPLEKADIQLIKGSKEFLIKTIHDIIGKVLSSTATLQECKVKEIEQIKHCPKEKAISFPLSLECPDSSPLTVPVSSINCSLVPVGCQPITATVTPTTQPGVYNIHCNPLTRGRHQVNVLVHDVQLENTSIVIPFNPYLDTITPVRPIGDVDGPYGVAVSDNGNIVVSNYGPNYVTILDRDGKQLKRITENVSPSPRGVIVTPDNCILVSNNSHLIQKIDTTTGNCVKAIGGQGKGPLQFYNPTGIAISPITGRVFVADYSNHRIQVITPDLTALCRFIGKGKGTDDDQFNGPWDVAINSKGLVYVTDRNNHCIQVFTPDGKFGKKFGTEGSDPGQLSYPEGITIDSTDLVYVTEYGNHRVSVFTSEGEFARSFGGKGVNEDQFNCPRGIIFDKEGVLYVSDYNNKRLVLY